jgi:hypothetical protein
MRRHTPKLIDDLEEEDYAVSDRVTRLLVTCQKPLVRMCCILQFSTTLIVSQYKLAVCAKLCSTVLLVVSLVTTACVCMRASSM